MTWPPQKIKLIWRRAKCLIASDCNFIFHVSIPAMFANLTTDSSLFSAVKPLIRCHRTIKTPVDARTCIFFPIKTKDGALFSLQCMVPSLLFPCSLLNFPTLFWPPDSVSTLKGSYGRCKGRCSIGVVRLASGILLAMKWLLS